MRSGFILSFFTLPVSFNTVFSIELIYVVTIHEFKTTTSTHNGIDHFEG